MPDVPAPRGCLAAPDMTECRNVSAGRPTPPPGATVYPTLPYVRRRAHLPVAIKIMLARALHTPKSKRRANAPGHTATSSPSADNIDNAAQGRGWLCGVPGRRGHVNAQSSSGASVGRSVELCRSVGMESSSLACVECVVRVSGYTACVCGHRSAPRPKWCVGQLRTWHTPPRRGIVTRLTAFATEKTNSTTGAAAVCLSRASCVGACHA